MWSPTSSDVEPRGECDMAPPKRAELMTGWEGGGEEQGVRWTALSKRHLGRRRRLAVMMDGVGWTRGATIEELLSILLILVPLFL